MSGGPTIPRRSFALCTVLFALLAALFLVPVVHGTDGAGYYSYLRSAVIDGDLDLANEYEYFSERYPYIGVRTDAKTGKVVNPYTIGTAILWAPFFLLAHATTLLLGRPPDGYTSLYPVLTMLGSAFYAAAGVMLTIRIASQWVGGRFAVWGVVVFFLSSHVFFYAYLQPSMAHAASFFVVALFVHTWYFGFRTNPTLRTWVTLGLAGGLMCLVRPQNGVFLALPPLHLGLELVRGGRDRLGRQPALGLVWGWSASSYLCCHSSWSGTG